MTPEDFRDLIRNAGLPSGYAAAAALGLPMRTVQHWLSGERRMSAAAAELACIVLVAEGRIEPGVWMRRWVRPSICALLH